MMPSGSLLTPIGRILVTGNADRIDAIRIGGDAPAAAAPPQAAVAEALVQLAAWFEGRLSSFDLPLAPAATRRGEALRTAIAAIRPGDVRSYGVVANSIGSSPRAVGQACARNPFPIVIPCHRVIGAGGTLGHYSAGDGVSTKRWLLAHERKDLFDE